MLKGVSNGTSDLDWDGLPPPNIHESGSGTAHALSVKPSSNDSSFLYSEHTGSERDGLNMQADVTLEFKQPKHTQDPVLPPPPPPTSKSAPQSHTSSNKSQVAGLCMKFTDTQFAASITLGFMGGTPVLKTSLRRPTDCESDVCFHYSLSSVKERRIVSKSSANFVLQREPSGRNSFVSTHHQNKDGSTISGVVAQNANKDVTLCDEHAVYRDVEFVKANLGMKLREGKVTFECNGRIVRTAGGFEMATDGSIGSSCSSTAVTTAASSTNPLTLQQPTTVRVNKSAAGTFVLSAGGVARPNAAPSSAAPPAATAKTVTLMAGVVVENETEDESVEATWAQYILN